MIIRRHSALNFLVFVGALLYALCLAGLPVDGFVDRDNYLLYVQNAEAVLSSNLKESYFYFFSNEPLWLLLNQIIGFFLSPENGVRLIILLSSFAFFFSIGKEIKSKNNNYLVLLLFFIFLTTCPQILKNFVIHLRQGVALAIFFLLAGSDKSLKRNVFAVLIAAQIHSSFYFLFFILSGLYFSSCFNFSGRKSILLTCTAILVVAPLALFFSVFFEARQSVLVDEFADASGAAFVFWLIALIIFSFSLFKNSIYFNDWRLGFAVCSIVLYLSLYYSFPYSGRIFESCLPLLTISLLSLPFFALRYLSFMLVGLFIYQWSPLLTDGIVFRLAG